MKTNRQPRPYSTLQNTLWELSLGWRTRKRGIVLYALSALAEILNNLAGLCIAPIVLGLVEQHAALPALIGTILLFTYNGAAAGPGRKGLLQRIRLLLRH